MLQIIFVWTVVSRAAVIGSYDPAMDVGPTALAVSLSNTPNEKRSLHRTAVFHVNVFIYRAT